MDMNKSVYTGPEQETGEKEARNTIRRQLDQLGKAVSVLDEEVHTTIGIFDPVLAPEQDVSGENPHGQVHSVASPIAEELSALRERLERISRFLADTRERINL